MTFPVFLTSHFKHMTSSFYLFIKSLIIYSICFYFPHKVKAECKSGSFTSVEGKAGSSEPIENEQRLLKYILRLIMN